MKQGTIIGCAVGGAVALVAGIIAVIKSRSKNKKKKPGVAYYTIQNGVKQPLYVDGQKVKRSTEVEGGEHTFKYSKQELRLTVASNLTFRGETAGGVPIYE